MRICSLFSSATELLYALGLGRSVVGRSERCDYPAGVRRKPIVVRSRIASERLSSQGIDEAVQALRRQNAHQYTIDVPLLKRLRPDLLVTQELCNVCAASHPEVNDAIRQLSYTPQVALVNARRFDEVETSIQTLGRATGRLARAKVVSNALRQRVKRLQARVRGVKTKPRVWCAEWLEPLMAGGHWVPELVEMAGGHDGFGRPGEDSRRLSWNEVVRYDPEVVLVMPCSFSIARTSREFSLLSQRPGWAGLSAAKSGRVFAVEGALFHRPGPRLVTGLEVMAALFHPTMFRAPSSAYAKRLIARAPRR